MAIEVFDMISGLVKSQLFTVSGTWTKPTSLKGDYIKIRICGGGGGGAETGTTDGSSGEAGYFIERIIQVTGNLTVTIGAGGAINSNGSNSSVSVGASLTASGGRTGRVDPSNNPKEARFNAGFLNYGMSGRGRTSAVAGAEAGLDGACEIIWSE